MTHRETTASATAIPPLGVIEGFFGRPWPWSARRDYAGFLAEHNFDFYLYAPKADPYLRREWQQDWPEPEWNELRRLRASYRQAGIRFGIGLSPLELYRQPSPESHRLLEQKVRRINELEPDILCLLFDDMRGDLPELALRQAELATTAAEVSSASQLILCPTYYSLDPVLEKVFGARPAHYWETLGRQLPDQVDVFWTGPKVCSTDYPREHLLEVSDWLRRKPFLWDNYPVNDSAEKSQLLQLMAYPESHTGLRGLVAGHAVNPMNQPALSKIPLRTLPRAYREGERYRPVDAFAEACRAQCPPDLARQLIADQTAFQDRGLAQMDQQERQSARSHYEAFTQPEARELRDWLNGDYAFDPACLTD